MQPQSAFVEANGIRLHYLEWGDAGAPPAVLLHPTGFLAWTWQPVAEGLAAAGFRVLAYDARGHGDSDKPEGDYHWRNMADDMEAFLDRQGIRQAPLIGHSMGGGVAAYLAAERPEYVSRLVLVEPIILPPGPHPDPETRNSLAEGARRRRMVFDSVEEVIESYRSRDAFKRWRPEVLQLYAEHGTFRREDGRVELKCPGEIEGKVFDASPSLNIWEAVPRIGAPVLVIRGEHTETMLSKICESVAERAPDARLVTIADAGHMAPMERPEAVTAEVLSFLRG